MFLLDKRGLQCLPGTYALHKLLRIKQQELHPALISVQQRQKKQDTCSKTYGENLTKIVFKSQF